MKRLALVLCLVSIGVASMVPAFAGAPIKVATVAPIAELAAEAEGKIAAIETGLASADSFNQGKKGIAGDAGVLAVLAQGVAESDGDSAWKKSAADVRDAAIALANAKTFDEAKKSLEAVKAAQGGKASGAKADADWAKLAKLGAVMAEVNKRHGKLRRATKKAPADASESARDASVLAVLSLAAHEDTHEVKSGKPADIAKWKSYSKDMQKHSTAAADALRKKNDGAFKETFTSLNKSCSECHKDFRDAE
ncbi:MAG: cytochrome c [Planctomycetales bacterium]|nr:cytochrome c [Planctomycetales bacterium]